MPLGGFSYCQLNGLEGKCGIQTCLIVGAQPFT